MTTEPATKRCPFCAEDIKPEAIKCRFCGEMLNGASPPSPAGRRAVHETKTFVIPFPSESPVTRVLIDFASPDRKFSGELFSALGFEFKPDQLRSTLGSLNRGLTYIWDSHKDYFLERLNDMGLEGWELGEGWERIDQYGFLVNAIDRFEFQMVETRGSRTVTGKPTLFGGPRKVQRIVGAKFTMKRTTFS